MLTIRSALCVTVPATVTALPSISGFTTENGCVMLTIQNIDASADIEVGWSSGSAPTTGSMGIIAPLSSVMFNVQAKDVNRIYLCGTGTTKAYIWQEGL